jgi:hypothetical protein
MTNEMTIEQMKEVGRLAVELETVEEKLKPLAEVKISIKKRLAEITGRRHAHAPRRLRMADINAFLRSQPNQTANAKQVVEHFDSKPNSSATALAMCAKHGWAERVSPGVYRWIKYIPKKRGNK